MQTSSNPPSPHSLTAPPLSVPSAFSNARMRIRLATPLGQLYLLRPPRGSKYTCGIVPSTVSRCATGSNEICALWVNAISGIPTGSFHTGEQKPVHIRGSARDTAQSLISVKSGGGGGGNSPTGGGSDTRPPPEMLAVAFNCVAPSGVGYVMGAGLFQLMMGVPLLTVRETSTLAVV